MCDDDDEMFHASATVADGGYGYWMSKQEIRRLLNDFLTNPDSGITSIYIRK